MLNLSQHKGPSGPGAALLWPRRPTNKPAVGPPPRGRQGRGGLRTPSRVLAAAQPWGPAAGAQGWYWERAHQALTGPRPGASWGRQVAAHRMGRGSSVTRPAHVEGPSHFILPGQSCQRQGAWQGVYLPLATRRRAGPGHTGELAGCPVAAMSPLGGRGAWGGAFPSAPPLSFCGQQPLRSHETPGETAQPLGCSAGVLLQETRTSRHGFCFLA